MDIIEQNMIRVVNDHHADYEDKMAKLRKAQARAAHRQMVDAKLIRRSEAIQKGILWTLAAITALTAAGTLILSAI